MRTVVVGALAGGIATWIDAERWWLVLLMFLAGVGYGWWDADFERKSA